MNNTEKIVREKYKNITNLLIKKSIQITTMESCTCGLIASLLTDTEGSSAIFKGSHVTYSNETKIKEGVPAEIINTFGVYSEETAASMARTALDFFRADLSVGITGTTGNADPCNNDSIPGEIYFAVAYNQKTHTFKVDIPVKDTRYEYKLCAANEVADVLIDILSA